jgi:S1-C subfamily serine protease
MEYLTKQQIVLLTLFTTFVASIATGIVVVSLMDQSPTGVTSTINHVIERTVEKVVSSPAPDQTAVATSAVSQVIDPTANAISKVSKSVVKIKLIKEAGATEITGLGIFVSKSGVILTDKSTISQFGMYDAVLPDGKEYPVQTLVVEPNTDVAFLSIKIIDSDKASERIIPATLPIKTSNLGQSIMVISGLEEFSVNQGIIKKIHTDDTSTANPIDFETNIVSAQTSVGSPLVDLFGNVIGFRGSSLTSGSEGSSAFYPTILLKDSIPTI